MQGLTPSPANQQRDQGEEASRGIPTAARGSEEGGAKWIATVHTELLMIIMV